MEPTGTMDPSLASELTLLRPLRAEDLSTGRVVLEREQLKAVIPPGLDVEGHAFQATDQHGSSWKFVLRSPGPDSNELHLDEMGPFLQQTGLKAGDLLVLSKR